MTREEKINTLKAIIQECEEYQWQRKETLFEIIKDLEQEPFINKPCVSNEVCEHDKNVVLDKIKKDVKGWYWKADKQRLAEDPCVVDAMIDLFIRTINKYKQSEEEK